MAYRESESDDDDFHSLRSNTSRRRDDDALSTVMEPPVHPVSSLQGPFEESILESAEQSAANAADKASTTAQARRQKILDADVYDDSWMARWGQRAEARFHPLLKLMAQVIFGLHLLQQEQAKSDDEVVKILQGHVNEVDSFLESTAEDFDLAIKDIQDRIRYMRLPMEHIDVFHDMLQDKKFRANLVAGNAKIEKIVRRTERAMNAAMVDIDSGVEATKELAAYLSKIDHQHSASRRDVVDIFDAMRGNERGWSKYLRDLKEKNSALSSEMTDLRNVVTEISRLIVAVSRHSKPDLRTHKAAGSTASQASGRASPGVRSRFSRDAARASRNDGPSEKPLPKAPAGRHRPVVTMQTRPHPVPFETRYEQPREKPPIPSQSKASPTPDAPNGTLSQNQSRGKGGRSSRHGRGSSASTSSTGTVPKSVASKQSRSPRSSHSPTLPSSSRSEGKKLGRSQSQGANELMSAAAAKTARHAASMSVDPTLPPTEEQQPSRKDSAQPGQQPAEQTHSSRWASRFHSQAGSKDRSWTSSAAFARRISNRLKHERASPLENPFLDSGPRPIDSAHSSEPQSTAAAAGGATDAPAEDQQPQQQQQQRKPPINCKSGPDAFTYRGCYQYPPPRLGFDPSNTDFGRPLNAMTPDVIAQINGFAATAAANGRSAKSRAAGAGGGGGGGKVGRAMSLRNFFRRGPAVQ